MERLERLWRELTARTDYEACVRPRAARFRLDPVRELLSRLGDPQAGVPVLHLAGSKGKGSVAHFLERGLRASGLRTGLYTSPHLSDWRERVRIDGLPARRRALADGIERVLAAARGEETFFDLLTATAFVVFAAEGCDAWVVEVGLGGRFDSTNAVRAVAAAVTSIEREHTDVLGDDLRTIAGEKAGIFDAGARLWSALPPEHVARPVLVERAAEVGEPLLELPLSVPGRTDLPHPQPHMQRNYALARAMLADLALHDERFSRAPSALDSLPPAALRLPGRWEPRRLPDGRLAVFDVAHTPVSLAAALDAFRAAWPDARRGVVFGLRDDKDAGELAAALGAPPAGETWWTAPAGDHPRSADPRLLAAAFEARVLEKPSFPAGPEVLLITGSTYLVGALRPATREEELAGAGARTREWEGGSSPQRGPTP